MLVMLIPANPANVVPGRCLMAEKTLIYSRILHAGNGHRDHSKVLHIVARRLSLIHI